MGKESCPEEAGGGGAPVRDAVRCCVTVFGGDMQEPEENAVSTGGWGGAAV